MRLELFFVLWLVCLAVPRSLPLFGATETVAQCSRLALQVGFLVGAVAAYALSRTVRAGLCRTASCCGCAVLAVSWFAIAGCVGGEGATSVPFLYAAAGVSSPFCVPHWAKFEDGDGKNALMLGLAAALVCAWAVLEACLIAVSACAPRFAPVVCGFAALLCLTIVLQVPVRDEPSGADAREAFASVGQLFESVQVYPPSVLVATVVFWTAFGFALWPTPAAVSGIGMFALVPVALVAGGLAGVRFVRPTNKAANCFTTPRLVAPYLCCAVSILPLAPGSWRSLFVAIVAALLAFSLVLTVDSIMEIAQHDDRCPAAVFTGSVLPCAAGLLLGSLLGCAAALRGGLLAPAAALTVGAAVATSASFLLVERNSLPLWRQGSLTREGALIDWCAQMQRAYRLTDREADVLFLVAKGCNASSIASQMYLSPHTVKTHMKHIYSKMGVRSQQEIISLMQGAVLERMGN